MHRLPPKEKAPLRPEEIPTFIDALEAYRGSRITAIALYLLLLTFVRPSELREAEWSEFDLDKLLWRIPAARMKMKEEHIVPLSHQAITLLRELQGITGQWRYLFPNTRDLRRPMQITA